MMNGGSNVTASYSPRQKRTVWFVIAGLVALLLLAGVFWLLVSSRSEQAPSTDDPLTQTALPPLSATFDTPSGATVTGSTTLKLTISDINRVEKVEYYVDDVFIGVTYARPFSMDLDTSTLAAGEHTITAKIYDTDGNMTTEETIIMVEAQAAPTPTVTTSARTPAKTTSSSSSQSSSGSSGGSAPAGPDTTAPSTPAGLMLSADDGYTANLSWTASTDTVGVTGYTVYRDGLVLGTSTTTSYKDQTVVPGNTYEYYVVAYDAASNTSGNSSEPDITLEPTTIWIDGDTPAGFDSDGTAIEVGVKFRPLVNGKVTGVRFYKGTLNTGTHVGKLWTSGGSSLATANFTGESASGWQEVTFATPVDVVANTTYVASYFAPNGHVSFTSSYFGSRGITSQYLRALASGVDGNNGVFNVGAGFPTNWFNHTSYWVDVTFAPNPAAGGPAVKVADNTSVFTGFPGSNNTGVTVGRRLPVRDRSIDARQPGATIENIEVRGDSINVFANNTTVRNTRVTSPSSALTWGIRQNAGVSGLTVEDTEIYGNGTNQIQHGIIDLGSGLTVTRANIHTVSNGIEANQSVSVSSSFIHDMLEFVGDENNAFRSTGGNNITLTGNTLHNPNDQTSALGLFCDTTSITNVTATGNLIMGGDYAIYAGGELACPASNNIKFINNRISRSVFANGGFTGPVINYNAGLAGNQWTGNVWDDDGTTVNP